MNKIAFKADSREKSDAGKKSDQGSSRSNIEQNKNDLSKQESPRKASQAGFSEPGSGDTTGRNSTVDDSQSTVGIPSKI